MSPLLDLLWFDRSKFFWKQAFSWVYWLRRARFRNSSRLWVSQCLLSMYYVPDCIRNWFVIFTSTLTSTTITTYLFFISDEKIEGQKRGEVTRQEVVSQFHHLPAPSHILLSPAFHLVRAPSPIPLQDEGGDDTSTSYSKSLKHISFLVLQDPHWPASAVLPTPQTHFWSQAAFHLSEVWTHTLPDPVIWL